MDNIHMNFSPIILLSLLDVKMMLLHPITFIIHVLVLLFYPQGTVSNIMAKQINQSPLPWALLLALFNWD